MTVCTPSTCSGKRISSGSCILVLERAELSYRRTEEGMKFLAATQSFTHKLRSLSDDQKLCVNLGVTNSQEFHPFPCSFKYLLINFSNLERIVCSCLQTGSEFSGNSNMRSMERLLVCSHYGFEICLDCH